MPTKTDSCPESVRRWFARIGAKGGQAGKGTETRRKLSQRAARIRWSAKANGATKAKPKPKPRNKKKQMPKKPAVTSMRVPAIVHQTRAGEMRQPAIGFK